MTPMTVRGVPRSLSRDAWWIAADSQTGVGSGGMVPSRPWWVLPILVAGLDGLLLHTSLGLGLVAAVLSLAAAAHWFARGVVDRKRAGIAWGVLVIALIPAVEVVQFTSFLFAVVGLAVFAGLISGPLWGRAAARLPFYGIAQGFRDVSASELRGPGRALFLDWLLPVSVGAVFIVLMVSANPLVEGWLSDIDLSSAPAPERVVMWGIFALGAWPLLRLAQMKLHKVPVTVVRKPVTVAYLNPRSVMRALVLFNLIFAVQTVMDLGYLWGGVRLPEGMNYATYAHRGAYPLMMTALLAGAFALVAQPWLDGRLMRGLLLVWVAQTVLLVVSSILRLDLYVGVYGLTHLRFAAFVWMAVVALGLVVLVMQIVGRKSTGWMLRRAFGVGLFAVYVCSLTNVSALVARQQLTTGPIDSYYLCEMGEGAAVEIKRRAPRMCQPYQTWVQAPDDLRDWGFRNWRLRRSLDMMEWEAWR